MNLRRADRAVILCLGTDIPPMRERHFWIYGIIQEQMENKKTNILAMNEIFDGFTFTKKRRFNIISMLIKIKAIKRHKITPWTHAYEIIPKLCYRKSTEMRIYQNVSGNKMREFTKDFSK